MKKFAIGLSMVAVLLSGMVFGAFGYEKWESAHDPMDYVLCAENEYCELEYMAVFDDYDTMQDTHQQIIDDYYWTYYIEVNPMQ